MTALGDIWAYDPPAQAWTQGSQPDAPPRQLYALASAGTDALLFGGGTLDGDFLADTWRIDAATLALAPVPATPGPSARSGATLIIDPAGNRTLLFGGANGDGLLEDMWQLQGYRPGS